MHAERYNNKVYYYIRESKQNKQNKYSQKYSLHKNGYHFELDLPKISLYVDHWKITITI